MHVVVVAVVEVDGGSNGGIVVVVEVAVVVVVDGSRTNLGRAKNTMCEVRQRMKGRGSKNVSL
jgi:hypothetical protein